MKKLFWFLVILSILDYVSKAKALENDYKDTVKERWTCTDDSSQRNGSVWSLCGVAQAKTEANARELALDKAIYEFKALCEIDTGCKDHNKTVEPKRTSCKRYVNDMWKCWRMMQVTVY
jgi:hypothetical protein